MGRKKSRPIRSGGTLYKLDSSKNTTSTSDKLENGNNNENISQEINVSNKMIYMELDSSNWASDGRFDVAEIILNDVRFSNETIDYKLLESSFETYQFALRLCLCDVPENSFRLGQWPVLSSDKILLEYLTPGENRLLSGCIENRAVLFSGTFDGPDESVSALAHLVNLRVLSLRLSFSVGDLGEVVPSFRVRVEILKTAFHSCGSLLETVRQPWRKSMMSVISWLRPEVTSSEYIYRAEGTEIQSNEDSSLNLKSNSQFDVSGLYEAIKPSRDEPLLRHELKELIPELRPYQRRAAYWMVRREMGSLTDSQKIENELHAPYCVPVQFLQGDSRMFYNPFNGNISLQAESSFAYVSGGILADEMGLGKTVELLACLLAHRKPPSRETHFSENNGEINQMKTKRQKIERVECICGAASESSRYKGLWVQCDMCDAWQHAECVGFTPKTKRKDSASREDDTGADSEKTSAKSKNRSKKKAKCEIVETEEKYVCSLCNEIMEATQSTVASHATLVVCPGPILAQWHSEITRHTRPGSLKICIYEGARNLDSSANPKVDITELATADIVLTTYDVLKEDLSHDSDRHEGDRHFLRFQKRYPVVPTLLTRIHWWRLCLDEAQMVECSKASVTEMAMRLHAQHRWAITGTPIQRRLDDLFGLLHFLGAFPFDIYKWWAEIIRDPYERRDTAAMDFSHKFLKQILWRSSKIHVSDELQLPPQEEFVSWLNFSPIEEHFYQKQHATCVDHAHDIIKNLKEDSSKRESNNNDNNDNDKNSSDVYLSQNEVVRLLGPLLKLRQACCHPQVGSSGLCSLQRDPLPMDEILQVLIGKAKIEGEEELRKIIVALNGLAGIAAIEQETDQAISLYKEALTLAKEHHEDFRIDPLLNLHINHNLAELLRNSAGYLQNCPLSGKRKEISEGGRFNRYYVKRRKTGECKEESVGDGAGCVASEPMEVGAQDCLASERMEIDAKDRLASERTEIDTQDHSASECFADLCLRGTCEKIIQKYLSTFSAKLLVTQQEFKASLLQVSTISKELENENMNWWLHALNCIEENKESSEELIRKIDHTFTRNPNGSGSVRVTSRFRSIGGLKLTIQNAIDLLQSCRLKLIERILEVDQTMENPNDSDIERQRYCPNCYDGNGSLCIQCEMDELFRVYEARLFLVKKSNNDAIIASVEEALDLQKREYELNHFFRNKGNSNETESDHGKDNHRFARQNIQVYRHPSAVETMLRVIKTHSKALLGKQCMGSAKKHLHLFEAMRKEFTQARLLSIAQSQLLRAHDEIKMSTSRLRLKQTDDEPSAVNILTREELIPLSLQFTSDKFLALPALSRIKGQLRYLKGMVVCNQKTQIENPKSLSQTRDSTTDLEISPIAKEEKKTETDNEPCPICREMFFDRKMVFQCGHFICCKCCLQMTEQAISHLGRSHKKWIMCPTCRQRTDFDDIAYVVDKQQDCNNDLKKMDSCQSEKVPESSIIVRGSYGTKMEAVTRRILWIISGDQDAKILVFSSWNDVLDVLEHALAVNRVSYARMKGGRKSQVAIAQFKGQKSAPNGDDDDNNNNNNNKTKQRSVQVHNKAKQKPANTKSVQVLLMLIQHGANGLNLLEAQHVILVEPLLNPGAEAQAISRVHRVGQDKRTFIHRFVVKSTIEESIYKLTRSRAGCSTLSRKTKNLKDEPVLTLKDVESLFPVRVLNEITEGEDNQAESLRHLPPAVAAGLAAQWRLMDNSSESVTTISD